MPDALPPLEPLHPDQVKVARATAGINAILMLPAAVGADWLLWRQGFAAPGIATLIWLLLAAWMIGPLPRRRTRAWGYRLDLDDLHVASGVWFRNRTLVPLHRVQHIDVQQGPLQRRWKIGTLVVYTAGIASTNVPLPGLGYEQALAMRDAIRAQIREEPA